MIDVDSTVFTRLSEAGAVLVAKLTLGALAQGDRWFGGQTKSPWDPANPNNGLERLVGRPGLRPRRPGWSASPSGPKRAARSCRPRAAAATPDCGRPTAG